jgi:hypothetical protein
MAQPSIPFNAESKGRTIVNTWYVAFSRGHTTAMRIVGDRSKAIAVACDLLDRGTEVTAIGPMLEIAEQQIDAATIRQIWLEHHRASDHHPWCSGNQ